MSTWRRIAIAKLPQHRKLIQESESVGMLWVDLWLRFVDAHRPPVDDASVKSTYEFASWCLGGADNADIASSTICHFYEHLPTEPLVRRELPKHMTREDFLGLTEVFKYHLTAEEHQRFVSGFLEERAQLLRRAS
jgi:hypothetical protein